MTLWEKFSVVVHLEVLSNKSQMCSSCSASTDPALVFQTATLFPGRLMWWKQRRENERVLVTKAEDSVSKNHDSPTITIKLCGSAAASDLDEFRRLSLLSDCVFFSFSRFVLVFSCLVLSVFSTIPAHQDFSSHCLLILVRNIFLQEHQLLPVILTSYQLISADTS